MVQYTRYHITLSAVDRGGEDEVIESKSKL